MEVWRIANFDMVPLDPDMYGQFYRWNLSFRLRGLHLLSITSHAALIAQRHASSGKSFRV